MYATAADLPPELVDLIVGIFTFTESITRSPEERGTKKRSLSLCSLVCRFWASRCRPLIFSYTILRCLEDFQTLSSFSTIVRSYVRDLNLEDTVQSVPWTHMVYAFIGQGGLSTSVNVVHTLDGLCTPTSVQTLRSLYHSLPHHPPNYIQDDFPLIIQNFRLLSFMDVVEVVRKLWGMMHWQITFRNVSWVTTPGLLPTVLATKNRGVCDRVELRDCPERWPFVWICISTRQPQPQPNEPVPRIPFLHPEEAVRLAELYRCLTSPTSPSEPPRCCANTFIDRSGPNKNNPTSFSLKIECSEKLVCTPGAKLICQNGNLQSIRLDFNNDPAGGCVPFDFDWVRFDEICSHCNTLAAVEVCTSEETVTAAMEFRKGMARRMKNLACASKLVVRYFDEDLDKWVIWRVGPKDAESEEPEATDEA